MTREKVRVKMFDVYSGSGLPELLERIAQCQLDLAESQNASWEDIELDCVDDYGSPMIEVMGVRPETDYEYETRLREEKEAAEDQKAAELKQYQALKAKFEGK